jgi:formylglycine-generating enzyme required for sulfatase activity
MAAGPPLLAAVILATPYFLAEGTAQTELGAYPDRRPSLISIPIPDAPQVRPFRLLRILAGSFSMGADELTSNSDERPIHSVRISRDFFLGETEVTQAQWQAVLGSLPTTTDPRSGIGRGDDYPIDSVSWDAVAGPDGFLARLNKRTAQAFRLPTEAEWEYACRAGTRTRFSFGDSLNIGDECQDGPAGTLPGNRSDHLWYCGNNGLPRTPEFGSKAVGLKIPNAWGLFDMHGNCFEFCSDWYQADFYSQPGATLPDPENQNAASQRKVIRGGSWMYDAKYSRSALRYGWRPDRPDWGISFRLALTLVGKERN